MRRREFIGFIGGAASWPLAAQAQQPGRDLSRLRSAPVAVVPPLLNQTNVDHAISRLEGVIRSVMEQTGVPGLAVAVVYKGSVLYAKGFGVREVGKPDPVQVDTVFLLASLSKPITSTIVATLVGRKQFAWHDPVHKFRSCVCSGRPLCHEKRDLR
jgi:CubicO group peptidase (beta-lactamase class C family)